MEDYLVRMIAEQRTLQEHVDPRPFTGDVIQQISYIKDMIIALNVKTSVWAAWDFGSSYNPIIHHSELMSELTDAWSLICNMWFGVMPGAFPSDIALAMNISHDVKMQLNHICQSAGYDGTNKCRGCGRSLDDPEVRCYVVRYRAPGDVGTAGSYCMASGSPIRQA